MIASGEIIAFGGLTVKFSLDENDTNSQLTVFEVTVNAGARVPAPHYHKDFDECLYALEGLVKFTVDGKPIEIVPGTGYFVPRGVVHDFENTTNERIKFLSIITPGILGPSYFKELAAVINAGGPPDMAKLKEIMLKYGLVPANN